MFYHSDSKVWSLHAEFNVWTLQEFESHAAQLDGAKLELKVGILSKAEEHAEALNRVATEVKQ